MALLDLPDEILVKIICQLGPHDINSLYGLDPIRQRLQQFISLTIDDEAPISFSNVPVESRIIIDENYTINCAGLLELFEITNFTSFNRRLLNALDQVPKICVIRDSIKWLQQNFFQVRYSRAEDLELFNRLIFEASKRSSSIKYLSFINLTKVVLENIIIDPSSIHLPNLEYSVITNCQSGNESMKFKWDKLKDLSITGPNYFESLHKSIDYSSCHNKLTLNNTGPFRFTDISFSRLRSIIINNEINDSDTVVIDNCQFPNLRELNVGVQNGFIMECVELPNLLKLSLECSDGQIILHDISANRVQAFEITTRRLPLIKNFRCFDLQLIYFDIEDFRKDFDFSFFQDIPNLIIKNHITKFLSKLNLSKLKFLGADLRLQNDSNLSLLEFPNLAYADISLDNHYQQIPYINAPNLKQLNVAESPFLTNLDNIPSDFPQLKELVFEMVQLPLTMQNLTFSNLISFEINMEGGSLEIDQCVFPKLESFFAIGSMFQTPSSIMIDAENLIEMKLENLDMDELVLANNPNLQSLSANRVQFVSAQDLDSLVYLDLSYNIMTGLEIKSAPNLRKFESIQSNAQTFNFITGLGLSTAEKLKKFGSKFKPELETVPLEEPIGVRSWMAKFYWDLSKTLRR